MTYFLDFDRTLFDIARALPYIFAKPACASLAGPPFTELCDELDALVREGKLTFKNGELTQFLFPDAEKFLETHECVIVTAGPEAWQRMKVESALPLKRTRVLYTGDTPKGIIVATARAEFTSPFYFADDSQTQLESVASLCPDVQIFEMRRDGAARKTIHPSITTLAELP